MSPFIVLAIVYGVSLVVSQDTDSTTVEPEEVITTSDNIDIETTGLVITNDTCCECITPSFESGCAADPVCEEVICSINNRRRCCFGPWGFRCVDAALSQCNNLETCCGCLTSSFRGGCRNDFECENIVCSNDPFCCNGQWDNICVLQANATCTGQPAPSCCSCTVQSGDAGCSSDLICEEAVCNVDPFCCGFDEDGNEIFNGRWDQLCVSQALPICEEGQSLPTVPPEPESTDNTEVISGGTADNGNGDNNQPIRGRNDFEFVE